jgi:hypothetical protein
MRSSFEVRRVRLQLLNVTDHVAQVKIAGAFGTWMISTFHPDHLPLLLRHSAKQNTDFPPSTPLDPAQVMDGNTSQVNMSLTTEDGAPPATAAEVTTSTASIFGETKPAPDLSTQVAPSPAPMFHPDSLVTLLIGPEEEKMAIHTTYLSLDSAFFKAALKK